MNIVGIRCPLGQPTLQIDNTPNEVVVNSHAEVRIFSFDPEDAVLFTESSLINDSHFRQQHFSIYHMIYHFAAIDKHFPCHHGIGRFVPFADYIVRENVLEG